MGDTSHGGEADGLAPVIPLFGGAAPHPAPAASSARRDEPSSPVEASWTGETGDDASTTWHPTWISPAAETSDRSAESESEADDAEVLAAEKALMRKLRGRGLSVREARSALRDAALPDAAADAVIARFLDLGYLDDEALAEQLIDKALSRKAQGRQAIAQTLSQRGLPRDVIEIALGALPDDEAERALEFARSKAAAMDGLERDVALRRLSGQLARRGYGSAALSAARQALDERSSPVRRVRFE